MRPQKLIGLAVLIYTLTCSLYAQTEWAPIGAKWYYTAPYDGKCIYMESVADTTIKDKECKIVELRVCDDERLLAREFLHQTGDSLLYYNYHHESFHTLYDFSAEVGDTVVVHDTVFKTTDGFYKRFYYEVDTFNSFKYKIVSIDSIDISGKSVRRQYVAFTNDSDFGFQFAYMNSYLYEFLGSEIYFFGRTTLQLEEFIARLRCYKDQQLDYINPEITGGCNSSLALSKKYFNEEIMIYPNPFTYQFTITSLEKQELEIAIYTLDGRLILKESIQSNVPLDVSFLNTGIYFIDVTSNKETKTFKVLKK